MSCKNVFVGCPKRTKIEICLSILISIFTVVLIYLMVAVYTADSLIDTDPDDDNICVTPTCVQSASNILDKINDDSDPCDDFYDFVCGKFTRDTVIPDEKTSVTTPSLIQDKVKRQLKDVLSAPLKHNDPKYLKLLKQQYISCMNTTKIENEGLNFVKKYFKELGGWPLLEQAWNEEKFDWKQLLYRLRREWRPVTFFIQMQIGRDMMNSSRRMLTITQPFVPSVNILRQGINDTYVEAYYDYITKLAILCGASELPAAVEMKEVLYFEIELAKKFVSNTGVNSVAAEHNPMMIRRLQETVPTIPWLLVINNYLAPLDRLTSKDIVNVPFLDYLKGLEDLLWNTKRRIIANYMFFKIIKDSVPHLPKKFRYEQLKYHKLVFGLNKITPRWTQCVSEVDKLSVAASAVYVKNFFDRSYKQKVTEIAEDIQDAFLETINDATWIDPETKKHAIKKVENMKLFVGYPDEILNDTVVDNFYKGLKLNPKDYYLKMTLNLSTFSHMKNVKTLRKGVNKTVWAFSQRSYVVNAFYNPIFNALEITPALMQGNFFHPDRPQYMNYGSIGEVIGHEIIHGFDNTGRQFDADGNLNMWWTSESLHFFMQRRNCLIKQYNNFTVSEIDMNLNGLHTLNENIADNVGLKIAYKAYLKRLDRNQDEPSLPGVNYTPKQIFWISAAIDKCAKYTEEYLKQVVANERHAPESFRILVPLMNSRYFAKDFNCSANSSMNVEDKCEIW